MLRAVVLWALAGIAAGCLVHADLSKAQVLQDGHWKPSLLDSLHYKQADAEQVRQAVTTRVQDGYARADLLRVFLGLSFALSLSLSLSHINQWLSRALTAQIASSGTKGRLCVAVRAHSLRLVRARASSA